MNRASLGLRRFEAIFMDVFKPGVYVIILIVMVPI